MSLIWYLTQVIQCEAHFNRRLLNTGKKEALFS